MNAAKVVMTEDTYKTGVKWIEKYARAGLENGYSMFGLVHQNRVYEIKKIVPAGSGSERSAASFSPDTDAIIKELEKEIAGNPNTRYLGDCHSHPWKSEPHPSSIDTGQLKATREDRPWSIIGIHSLDDLKFFGLDEDENQIEIPYQIVPNSFDENKLLARIQEITDNEKLKQKKVAILGCGSLSCGLIQSLAGTGLRSFLLGDMDSFSDVNIVRHIGGINDLGREKTEIIKDYIEAHNPLAYVQTVNDDFLKNRELLKSVMDWADIVIGSSGNPALNYQINIQCVKKRKPVVFGGIYDKAESAYVFCYNPDEENTACFDCIFGLTSSAIDNSTIKRKYGLEDGELKEAQGMFSDILAPGAMMAKMAIWLMTGETKEFNLVRYYNDLRVKRLNISKSKGCATCDYDGWMKTEEEKLKPKDHVIIRQLRTFSEKFSRCLRYDRV